MGLWFDDLKRADVIHERRSGSHKGTNHQGTRNGSHVELHVGLKTLRRPTTKLVDLKSLTPEGMDRIFFTNSGSESVETALKIALAYQKARGKPNKYRLIGRERAYHGVNFGGMTVGGITRNRMNFGPMVGGVDHLPHTHDITRNAFSKGQPEHGAEYADALERLIYLHDASTIAAVIVEPVSGSTAVLPPPKCVVIVRLMKKPRLQKWALVTKA